MNIQTMEKTDLIIDSEKSAIDYINNFPGFDSLTSAQKSALAQFVAFQNSASVLQHKAIIAKYDFDSLVKTFLASRASEKTKIAYQKAISDFAQYTKRAGYASPLAFISFANCDNYITSLKTKPIERIKTDKTGKTSIKSIMLSPASIRQHAACLCSLFSFIERQTEGNIKNCFLRSAVLPKNCPVRINSGNKFYKFSVGSAELAEIEKDIEIIKGASDSQKGKDFALIVLIMQYCGLRAGAFSSFEYKKNRFVCQTKGKTFKGYLPPVVINALQAAGKKENAAIFAAWSDSRLVNYFKYFTKNLYAENKIKYPYSAHDMRHYFAIKEYSKKSDVYRVCKLLGHSSVAITERYLRGLNLDL